MTIPPFLPAGMDPSYALSARGGADEFLSKSRLSVKRRKRLSSFAMTAQSVFWGLVNWIIFCNLLMHFPPFALLPLINCLGVFETRKGSFTDK